ncbi:MAG: hypothetical protein RLW87_04220 [Alphaproteobacteria bacterium]|uniref:hypothetical protein n=1 Tax=Pacificispira sp. TaxID=2888761 RepID=UPI001B298F21|nr:hypothetical protein [Alphaproteobacteria bacterium]MBO6862802.1 hypothetical protein [Alphaproteobacteria bacterium]
MIWCEEQDWLYEVFDLTTDPGEFGAHADFVRIWAAKLAPGKLPLKSEIGFEDFRGWWGWITLGEVLDPEGGAMRYRLWGSHVAELTRLEMTGKTMQQQYGERIDATNYNEFDLAFIQRLVREPAIGRQSGPVDWDIPDYQRMSTLRLPLSRDGSRVDYLVSAVIAT